MKCSHSPRAAELSPHEFRQVPSVTLRYKTFFLSVSFFFFLGFGWVPSKSLPVV